MSAQGWMIKRWPSYNHLSEKSSSSTQVNIPVPRKPPAVLNPLQDSVPLRDPSHLFDSGIYKAYGSVFWADLWKFHPHSALWRILGRTCSFEDWGFESGQILIDKTGQDGLNLAALWVSVAMLDNERMWSKYLYGDKDAFRFAFEILGLNFGRARTIPSLAGFIGQKSGQFCGS